MPFKRKLSSLRAQTAGAIDATTGELVERPRSFCGINELLLPARAIRAVHYRERYCWPRNTPDQVEPGSRSGHLE